jgi:hypothetical protein
MSLFDDIFKGVQGSMGKEEAFFAVLAVAMFIDGKVAPEEQEELAAPMAERLEGRSGRQNQDQKPDRQRRFQPVARAQGNAHVGVPARLRHRVCRPRD